MTISSGLIEDVTIPAGLSNRPLHEWCEWLLSALPVINKALSEREYTITDLQMKQMGEIQRERWKQAFAADHPDIAR